MSSSSGWQAFPGSLAPSTGVGGWSQGSGGMDLGSSPAPRKRGLDPVPEDRPLPQDD
eukprot:CAMPEP_0179185574 /NCGR_PEP_ID=MMETSP0796-20121207/92023_1 /TAXON_ID=73915 /ORGANISM="Pyrodinium bahamense, Strain pbaha01" /LENGTH=56 /DNA_ID=CAMNT_0020889535 /DNA_START=18 /DNA_END=185 /DNA_ORIENTATION=-